MVPIFRRRQSAPGHGGLRCSPRCREFRPPLPSAVMRKSGICLMRPAACPTPFPRGGIGRPSCFLCRIRAGATTRCSGASRGSKRSCCRCCGGEFKQSWRPELWPQAGVPRRAPVDRTVSVLWCDRVAGIPPFGDRCSGVSLPNGCVTNRSLGTVPVPDGPMDGLCFQAELPAGFKRICPVMAMGCH